MAVLRVDLRVDHILWKQVVDHLAGDEEQVAALLVRARPATDPAVLVVEAWRPVDEAHVLDRSHGLRWDGRFNLRVAREAESTGHGVVFVHRHWGRSTPRLPATDRHRGRDLIQFFRRRCPDATHGFVVVSDDDVAGWIEAPEGRRRIGEIRDSGPPLLITPRRHPLALDSPDDRQLLAFGRSGMDALATGRVGLVGVSGGGSHVGQQLIHAGIGTLVAVDGQLVEETNLRRLVGARRRDVDVTSKVDIPRRLARDVRPTVRVVQIAEDFPSERSLAQLRNVDVLIGCVDGWDVRDDLNSFALEHRIPYVDIGAVITPPTAGLGVRVSGQIAIVVPRGPCMRCMGLVTDARVAEARKRRQGYLVDGPEPQVVSINGTLASEAVTATMMLLAGSDTYVPRRRYSLPPGILREVMTKPDRRCPACRRAGLQR
jgi:molybdopterin/thiamine biosynthesis adenylyltransferase